MFMGRQIQALLRRLFPGGAVFVKGMGLLYSSRGFLRTSGYVRSVVQGTPCRRDGSPIPWMNYPVIGFLEERLKRDQTVFEFGSGFSTLFLAPRVRRVVSVECDRGWFGQIRDRVPDNVELHLCEPFDTARYLAFLTGREEKFDVIIVDAEAREACLDGCWPSLSDRGVVILDDSGRPEYQDAMARMLGRGFRCLHFEGLKPRGIRAYRTTVYYRDGNAFGI